MYEIEFSNDALREAAYLRKTEPAAYRKLELLLIELANNPRFVTGQIELMKYDLRGYYSRRITRKHRIVYSVKDDILTVYVVSVYGHYSDK